MLKEGLNDNLILSADVDQDTYEGGGQYVMKTQS